MPRVTSIIRLETIAGAADNGCCLHRSGVGDEWDCAAYMMMFDPPTWNSIATNAMCDVREVENINLPNFRVATSNCPLYLNVTIKTREQDAYTRMAK